MEMPKIAEPRTPTSDLIRFCFVHSGHNPVLPIDEWPNIDLPIYIKFDHQNRMFAQVSYWSSSFTNGTDPSEGLTWTHYMIGIDLGTAEMIEPTKTTVFNGGGNQRVEPLGEVAVNPEHFGHEFGPWLRNKAIEDRTRREAAKELKIDNNHN